MTTAIKRRRGTTTQHSTFTGLEGELTVDTTKDTVVVHDGSTAGGFALLREDLSNNTNVASTSTTQTFTNKTFGDNPTFSAGTANGVTYLNGSKVLTSGSALTFDGTNLKIGGSAAGNYQLSILSSGLSGTDKVIFQITDAVNTTFQINQTTSYSQLMANNALAFSNGTSELMRLTSTGLGIGTSSPILKFDCKPATNVHLGIGQGQLQSTAVILNAYNDAATANIPIEYKSASHYWLIGNTQSMLLDGSGNLGLGVTPSAWGSGYVAAQVGSASIFSLAGGSGGYFIGNGYFNGTSYIYKNTAAATRYEMVSGAHTWSTAPSGTAGNAISFTQAMTLAASGNLGIGTSSPSYKLDVSGASQGIANFVSSDTKSIVYLKDSGTTAGNVGLFSESNALGFRSGGAERMRIDSSGNVGIGTSSPGCKLDLGSTYSTSSNNLAANVKFAVTSISSTEKYGMYCDDAASLVFLAGSDSGNNAKFRWVSAGTERMRIDSSGNLLVGTTSAAARVTVVGASAQSALTLSSSATNQDCFSLFCTATTASVYGFSVYSSASSGNTAYLFRGYNDTSTLCFAVAGNGNVTNTNNSYGAISDGSLKENIVDATPKLTDLMQVRVRNFNLKADETKAKQIGVVAQELEQVFPSMIEENADGIKSVKYSVFVPMLVKAIQELKAELDATKAEVAALKAK